MHRSPQHAGHTIHPTVAKEINISDTIPFNLKKCLVGGKKKKGLKDKEVNNFNGILPSRESKRANGRYSTKNQIYLFFSLWESKRQNTRKKDKSSPKLLP